MLRPLRRSWGDGVHRGRDRRPDRHHRTELLPLLPTKEDTILPVCEHATDVLNAEVATRGSDLPTDLVEARALSAAAVSASRLSFERTAEHGDDPRAVFATVLEEFVGGHRVG